MPPAMGKQANVRAVEPGHVDESFEADPCSHQMKESEKGLAQLVITRRNPPTLLEPTEKPFGLLASLVLAATIYTPSLSATAPR